MKNAFPTTRKVAVRRVHRLPYTVIMRAKRRPAAKLQYCTAALLLSLVSVS